MRVGALGLLLLGCGGGKEAGAPGAETGGAAGAQETGAPVEDGLEDALVVVTFNTGTTESMGARDGEADGYGPEQSALSDAHYGDGLAWTAAVEATRDWLATVDPDVVAFQEIFWSGDCPEVPAAAREGFVCETWEEGDPTVAEVVLGPDYQVACHPGKPDKCLAVHARVGRFAGCGAALCLDGLEGETVEGCGQGARVGRGVVERPDGGQLVLVGVHGSSGLRPEDQACRVAQVDQVFVDLGGAGPAARGEDVIVLGDLNTDPGRAAASDASAARWLDFVGSGHDFDWISPLGPDAPRSYQDIADIDHVAAKLRQGDCWVAGIDGPPVTALAYFDHRPVVCTTGR